MNNQSFVSSILNLFRGSVPTPSPARPYIYPSTPPPTPETGESWGHFIDPSPDDETRMPTTLPVLRRQDARSTIQVHQKDNSCTW